MTYGINPQQQPPHGVGPPAEKKPIHKQWWFWAAVIVVVLFFTLMNISARNEPVSANPAPTITETATTTADNANGEVPREWESALNKAADIASRDYSKEGTRRALVNAYDFPSDAAQYAINNVNADWQQNAINKSQTLQDRDYSHTRIERVLVSAYHFTPEEAEHAVTRLSP